MPVLPGSSQPLDFVGGRGKAKGKAKARTRAKNQDNVVADVGTPPKKARKRKGDEELYQLDLRRQQILTRRNAETRFNIDSFYFFSSPGRFLLSWHGTIVRWQWTIYSWVDHQSPF